MSTTSPHTHRARMIQAGDVPRVGFTLVELLMVIVVIGILAGMLLVAVGGAMNRARRAAITFEINGLQTAMTSYKQNNGQFPPTMGVGNTEVAVEREQRILRHLRKRFPRFAVSQYSDVRNLASLYTDASGMPLDIDQLDAAESLVFWLGGFPDNTAQNKLQGFSADPSSPLKVGGSRTTILFDFDPTRLTDIDKDGWWEYIPDGTSSVGDQMPPYVYFDANSYAVGAEYPSASPGVPAPVGPNEFPFGDGSNLGAEWGGLRPYTTDSAVDGDNIPIHFHEPSTFQIISAGLDSIYGVHQTWRETSARIGWNEFDEDNLTNFHGDQLGDLPE